jgi:hypothetical protein
MGENGLTCSLPRLLLILAVAQALPARAQFVATTIPQLRAFSSLSNVTVTMAPGTYWITQNGSNSNFIDFTGSNSTFDLSGATFKIDTRTLDGLGSNHVNVFALRGSNSTLRGLDLEGLDVDVATNPSAQRWADATTNYVRIAGANNALKDANIVVRGSTPFGFGDVFGKGGNPGGGLPFVSHHKGLGVHIFESTGATIDNLDLEMHAFGHGIYMQKAQGLNKITNTRIVGELASSDAIIASPQYQATITAQYPQGRATYGPPLPPGIMISKSEDGIRSYGVIDGVGVGDIYLENTVVENMREAYSLMDALGTATVINAEAWDNETGFEPGTGTTITNSRGNATHGPLVFYRRNGINGSNLELELVQDEPQHGIDWDIVYFSGNNNEIALTSAQEPNSPSPNSRFRVGQRFNDWRHPQNENIDNGFAASNNSIMNLSGQDMVLGAPSLSGTSNYNVNSGKYLGGRGTISTSVQTSAVDVIFNTGSWLDPAGLLSFNVGAGDVELNPAVNAANSQTLRFELGPVSDSDKIEMLGASRLSIGSGVLNFDDFVFTTGSGFAGGQFTLVTSTVDIFGSLGASLAGTIEGIAAELSLSADGNSLLLTVAIPGDFDDDGCVDGDDLLKWQREGGTTAQLAQWRANFGSGMPAATAHLAAPEPASWLHAIVIIALTSLGPPRTRRALRHARS